ncbi:MAG: CRISPR-associated protein Cas4 [Ardenticatenaceae bacterium]|nr:CRISPR-associated protein Cas4 [Ardenticatenaceae bacterium]
MDESYLPLSYLNHLIYCPRRFWYMYIQGEIDINAPMLEGSFQHQTRADKPGQEIDDRGRAVYRRIWIWSDRLQIAGFADFVEAEGTALIPVEYKHGQQGKWDNDNVQLCAQALCLEEMTGKHIDQGEIFYWRSRRRITVPFDTELRQLTETTVVQAHELTQTNNIPAPISERKKCQHCSIQPICLPDEVTQLKKGVPTP